MAVYFKHTRTVTQNVPYQFFCEHCRQDSGPLAAEFKAEATRSLTTKRPLTEEEKAQLDQEAAGKLHQSIQKARRGAQEEAFSESFKDKCPHCGKPQSWALKGMKHLPFSYALIGAFFTALICLSIHLFGIVSISFGTGMAATLAAALALMAVGFIRVGRKNVQTKNVQEKQLPNIIWPGSEKPE